MGSMILSIGLAGSMLVSGSGVVPSYFGIPLGGYVNESEILVLDSQRTAKSHRYICFESPSGDLAVLLLDWQRETIRFHSFKYIIEGGRDYKCNEVNKDGVIDEFSYSDEVFARVASDDFDLVQKSPSGQTYKRVLSQEEGCFDFEDDFEGSYSVRGTRTSYLTVSVRRKNGILSEISESVEYDLKTEKVYPDKGCQRRGA